MGQLVFEYAEEIFPVGQELMEVLRGRPRGRPARFLVGISDMIPKLIAFRILEPVPKMNPPVELVCHEDKPDGLLSSHALDMVLKRTLPGLALRLGLEEWFGRHGVRPVVAGEFQDSALIKVFRQQYGRTEEITERYYAVSLERKLREKLF